MTADLSTSKHRADYLGEAFHFCSAGCRAKAPGDPARYVTDDGGLPTKPAPMLADTSELFTRPMHTEVRRVAPAVPNLWDGAGAVGHLFEGGSKS